VGIFYLQPIGPYVRTIGGSVHGRREIHLRNREEAHALVESPRHYPFVAKTHETPVSEHALRRLRTRALTSAAATGRRSRAHRSRLRRLDLDIVGERERVLDEAAPLVEIATDRCELWNAGGVEPSYDDHGGAVRPVR